MSGIGDRHEGSLEGQLTPAEPVSVGVVVDGEHEEASTQHAATMLVNLLARLEGVVSAIGIDAPHGAIKSRVTPFVDQGRPLGAAIYELGAAIGGVPLFHGEAERCDLVLHVGPGPAPERGWRLHGRGFAGILTRQAVRAEPDGRLPFGPYTAACIGAAEVFRAARLLPAVYTPIETFSYSMWDQSLSLAGMASTGPGLCGIRIEFGLAGVGAVGCALLHSLWACEGLTADAVIADSDPKGIEESNLNRCVIFGQGHIGKRKASSAASALDGPSLRLRPIDGNYEPSAVTDPVPSVVVSAVDTNRSRVSVQTGFWPARLLAASTRDLRAEFASFGPPGSGPCLGCFNPPEVDIPDDVHRAELRSMSDSQLGDLASRLGVGVAAIRMWAQSGECGELGDSVLAQLRSQEGAAPRFSVGFVSVFAGVGLAAALIKEHLGSIAPGVAREEGLQVKFQFMNPAVPDNGAALPVQRDAKCAYCRDDQPAVGIWAKRFAEWRPAETRERPA